MQRYIKPVRILSDAEVAEKIAGYLDGTDVTVPFQSVWPTLCDALVQAGVDVTEPRALGSAQMKIAMEAYNEWKRSDDANEDVRYSRRSDYQYTVDGARNFFGDDDTYHHFAKKTSETIAKNPRKKLHIVSVTQYGDDVFMCAVVNDGNRKFHLEDVAFIDVSKYNGRISTLIDQFERMYIKYGKERTARYLGGASTNVRGRFFPVDRGRSSGPALPGKEKDRILTRQVSLLENGIREVDFLKEIAK